MDSRSRRINDRYDAVCQQMLLNLMVNTDMRIIVMIDGEMKDYGAAILKRSKKINANFDAGDYQ